MKNKRRRLIEKNVLMFLENKTNRFENKIALVERTHNGYRDYNYKVTGSLSSKIANCTIHEAALKNDEQMTLMCD